jgi:hypothetical protein
MTYYEDDWIGSDAGNWCLRGEGNLLATVFIKTAGQGYGAVINCPHSGSAYFFPGNIQNVEDGQSLVENALGNNCYDEPPWRLHKSGWQRGKKAGNLYLRVNGGIYTIKQASSGSYYVVTQNGRWSCSDTGDQWFDGEAGAKFAVDRAIAKGAEEEEEYELDFDDIDFGD